MYVQLGKSSFPLHIFQLHVVGTEVNIARTETRDPQLYKHPPKLTYNASKSSSTVIYNVLYSKNDIYPASNSVYDQN